MIWDDKLKFMTPQHVAYIKDCLVIDGVKFPCSNPRLEFIRALKCFPESKDMDSIIDIDESVRIGRNCAIGNSGFGFERDENGIPIRMPHFAGVVIHKNVEIGNNVCIDRGVLRDTIICQNVKIDNLVHIAHGVTIGRNTMIVAGSVLGGSCDIGENCFIGIGAMIKNKVRIGKNVTIGMGAVVLENIPDNWTVIGNPAKRLIRP